MKRLVHILAVLLFAVSIGYSQENQKLKVDLQLSNVEFSEFARQLKSEYNIRVYYLQEWVKDIRVTSTQETELDELLSSILETHEIYFSIKGLQVFLTGSTRLSDTVDLVQKAARINRESTRQQTGRDQFGVRSYERAVKKAIVGRDQAGMGLRKVIVNGRITNSANGEPVIGATIVVPGTSTGSISDAEGLYSLTLRSGESYNLEISCMGMENERYLLEVRGGGILNIEMESRMIDVKEVVVRSGENHNVRGIQMGFQKIGIKDIKSIPAVMGERDIFKVATLMPGVQQVGEGSAGFNVRGSASDQNLFLLNDIPILNTGHLFGFFSAFNPDMVNDFNLYKSNFPVEYGGRLASVFDITTRKGNKKEFGARGSISPVTASLLLETPIRKDKSSFIFSTRSTYSDWILERLDDADVVNREANFYDIMGGFHLLGKKNASTQIFGYYSRDKFNLAGTNSYKYENLGSSISYDKPLKGTWHLKAAGVFSLYTNYQGNTSQASRSFEHEFNVRSQQAKLSISGYPWVGHKISFGADASLHQLNQGILKPSGDESLLSPIDFGKENGLESSLFVSDEISLTDNLTLYGGLRYSLFNYLGPNDIYTYMEGSPYEAENIIDTLSYNPGNFIKHYSGPEIRTALNYILGRDMSVKMSYNRMRQYLFMLSNTMAISPTDRWKLTDPYIEPPIADQVSLGLYKNLNNSSIETSAEVYYKKTQHVIEYKDGVDLTYNPNIETIVLQGGQNAWGAEFLVRRNTGRLNGWLSYTYSRSMIQIDGEEDWQKINQGMQYPANYDKPHAFNLVGNFEISRRLSISSNVVYSSGRPITYPTGYMFVDDYQVVNYSLRNEFRIPDYFRIDLSVNIEGNLRKKKIAHGSWMFSVYNLTGRRNAYSVFFTNERGDIQGYKLSIYGEPIFTISYNFKLGNYAVE